MNSPNILHCFAGTDQDGVCLCGLHIRDLLSRAENRKKDLWCSPKDWGNSYTNLVHCEDCNNHPDLPLLVLGQIEAYPDMFWRSDGEWVNR